MPRLSILMSVYNEEQYLELALRSLLEQTYEDFDIRIVDDASTDRTPKILDAFAQKDARILVVTHEERKGLAQSLNELSQATSSEYLGRMDGDDICHPQRLSQQIAYLEWNRDTGVLGTACSLIDEQGKELGKFIPPQTDREIRQMMPKRNPMVHPSVIIRRTVLESAGGYDQHFKYSQDYELWSRVADYTQFRNLSAVLLSHRLTLKHIAQVSRQRALYSLRARLCWIRRHATGLDDWVRLLRPLFWLLLPSPVASQFQRWNLRGHSGIEVDLPQQN
jgi:glycosyltransferase involved in cell wall biosynthesis